SRTPARSTSVERVSIALPETDGPFVRPAATHPAEPRWGHAEGLQVGLSPLPGPRGLLRVYTPYLDQPRERMINFVAVEPVPAGETTRGFSELEHSALDDAPRQAVLVGRRPRRRHAPPGDRARPRHRRDDRRCA